MDGPLLVQLRKMFLRVGGVLFRIHRLNPVPVNRFWILGFYGTQGGGLDKVENAVSGPRSASRVRLKLM